MPDDSLLDSPMSARDYKYIKDSYFSQNHPNHIKEDLSLFQGSYMRGPLDSAAKQKAEYLLALLDADRSVASQQQPQQPSAGQQLGRPQAASSPKMDSVMEHDLSARRVSVQYPEQSLGTVSANRTPSFQKHSMRAESSGLAIQALREKLSASTASKQTNYQPAQVQEVDDSFFKPMTSEPHNSTRPMSQEITPSPLRHASQQQFWTAKQTWDTKHIPATEPSLPHALTSHEEQGQAESMIAALGVLSPIRRRSLQPETTIPQAPLSPAISHLGSVAEQNSIDATRGDLTRKHTASSQHDHSDTRSALSKVDATSLQHAIQDALQITVPTPGAQSQHGTLGANIAARFRASRGSAMDMDGSGSGGPLLDLATPAKQPSVQQRLPSLGELQVLEPIKQGSPLQGEPSVHRMAPELQRTDSNKENSVPPNQTNQFVTLSEHDIRSLVEQLEQTQHECSRRGLIIDTLVQQSRQAGSDDVSSRENAQREVETPVEDARAAVDAARAFELEQAKQQMSEMKAVMQTLLQQQHQQQQQQQRQESVRESSIQQVANDLATAPLYNRSHSASPALPPVETLQVEESIADKMQRWDQSIQAEANATSMHARECYQTPSYLRDYKRQAAAYESPVSATHASLRKTQGLSQSQPQAFRLAEHVPLSPISAYSPVRAGSPRSQQAKQGQQPMTKPLLAANMPDYDAHRLGLSELYETLALAQVDSMDTHMRGNLIKNIAIQLNVPLHDLSSSICQLGSEAENREMLVHETIKLRMFAEQVHASLYAGARIEGSVVQDACLAEMGERVGQMVQTIQVLGRRQRVLSHGQ
ncbi:hypothetical protein BCR37DRAFT_381998 [Protomyces lactucae-debilis]|uniref:Uncharacterized protein n=1 Tax=Protomyces lactucae-debilis TaxID=2754530 RepID=A0A1Y2F6R8_PROLT|nr:uncharacterized protein BCR37DRAFT_381998 [Protomyces lactucae-debilis]ORY79026.1 hypothetical protein BCR37DRAFT_381998 [Protomyces lactucae-debilis]